MDVANLLTHDAPRPIRSSQVAETTQSEPQRAHQYPTRHSVMTNMLSSETYPSDLQQASQLPSDQDANAPSTYNVSPQRLSPKNVAFELRFDGSNNHRARLPMRVQIFPHDTTDSIVTTVKNFYGLYEGAAKGVSFEDERGNILIASFENFENNMSVYVRVVPDYSHAWQPHGQIPTHAASPISAHRVHPLEETYQMLPPQPAQALSYGQPTSRPSSRLARKKSASPRPGKGSRSASAQKHRPRTHDMSREDSFQSHLEKLNSDSIKGYASSDGEGGSVTSSRKARSEQLASADISLDNILEGNRRKRAKFESSELPLFVPPQVPAANSISSISPQRRSNGQDNPSPFAKPSQRTFAYNTVLQSPQSYGYSDHTYGIVPQSNTPTTAPPTVQQGRRLRDRTNPPSLSARSSTGAIPRVPGFGILPTPDPTIASCISDEDVALQLMRLGDISNISHGRTSASTLDETLSGRADVASSATSDSDEESHQTEQPTLPMPQGRKKLRTGPDVQPSATKKQQSQVDDGLPSMDSGEPSGDDEDEDYQYEDKKDGFVEGDLDDMVDSRGQVVKSRSSGQKQRTVSKANSTSSSKNTSRISKSRSIGNAKKVKPSILSTAKVPPSPVSIPPQSRKTSSASTVNFQHQGEEDLSSKPRCQRCRKSKKGCDRQRPCGRCKDAGLGADACISEDEGNGRKGRFGRHMGVAVKHDLPDLIHGQENEEDSGMLDNAAGNHEKSKKRKR